MLNIRTKQCENVVEIEGILKELEVDKRTTNDGRDYISAKAIIGVDQEIKGQVYEEEIPVRMFSMRLKKDGGENQIYNSIAQMAEDYTSLAAADEPSQADRVIINRGKLEENLWVDPSTKMERTGWQVSTNFISKKSKTAPFEQRAKFQMTCVVGNDIDEEYDKEGNPTGRLILKAIVIGYNGKADIIDVYITDENAKNHVKTYWNKGDTVKIAGYIVYSQTVETYKEEMGFGEDITRTRTKTSKELILASGSKSGLEEEFSYDADDIKVVLSERKGRIEAMKNKSSAPKPKKNDMNDFGF
jgi:hypothetical protein